MSTPTTFPTELVAGDSLACDLTFSDYKASDGWVLSFALRNATSAIDLPDYDASPPETDFTTSNETFEVRVSAATTLGWTAGTYNWQAYVTSDDATERHLVSGGVFVVKPNFSALATYDGRTHNQKVLAAIRALLEGKFTSDVQQYTIGTRQLTKMTVQELREAELNYAMRVAAEAGKMPRTMKVRFTR